MKIDAVKKLTELWKALESLELWEGLKERIPGLHQLEATPADQACAVGDVVRIKTPSHHRFGHYASVVASLDDGSGAMLALFDRDADGCFRPGFQKDAERMTLNFVSEFEVIPPEALAVPRPKARSVKVPEIEPEIPEIK